MHLRKLGIRARHVGTPAKVVDNEAPDAAGRHGGVDHECLQGDATRADDADGAVVTLECSRERGESVGDLEESNFGGIMEVRRKGKSRS